MKKFFLIVSLYLVSSNSLACNCASFTLEEMVINADSIFLARLSSASSVTPVSGKELNEILKDQALLMEFLLDEDKRPHIEATFDLIETFKGESIVLNKLTVKTGVGESDCGVPMIIGRFYVIFKRSDSNYISTCNGSHMTAYDEGAFEQIRDIVERYSEQ